MPNLLHPSENFTEPEDLDSKIKYLRNLSNESLHSLNLPHNEVTTSLVKSLAARVNGEAGYTLGDIDEIVALCHRLLAIDTPPDLLTSAFQALTRAVLDELHHNRRIQPLDRGIECLKKALKTRASGWQQVSFDLANLLAARFLTLHTDDDYQEAKTILQDFTSSRSPGHLQGPYHIQASALITAIELARLMLYSNVEDLDGATSRCRSFLDSCSHFGNPLQPVIAELLVRHAEQVSGRLETLQGSKVAHSNVDDTPSSRQLGSFGERTNKLDVQTGPSLTDVEEQIERLRYLYSTTLPGTERQRKCLNALVRCYDITFSLTQDVSAIEEAIICRRMLLVTTHPSDPSLSFHRSSFANFLRFAFSHLKRIEYLDETVTLHREVLAVENARLIHFVTIRRLIEALSTRWRLFRHKPDLDEIMELFASGVEDTHATVPSRFELACDWAYTARISVHRSLPTAYEYAMSLMQSSLVFAPTLPIQHDRLVENRDLYEKTPLNFASYQIRMGKVEQAIETLEQGRALLWSEMHGLRTSTDQLDADLAKKITVINKEIEMLTTTTSLDRDTGTVDQGFDSYGWMAQLPGLIVKQQELLKKRDALISEIRELPGLENFLLPLPSDTLRSASSHGPVIIINHCKWRSDIIIVRHNSPPSLITTPYYFFGRVNKLKDNLLEARRQRCGPNSQQYVDTLVSVQKDLYELIGRPVIERLNDLGIPEQSRVWWCPTSVLGYLPLHAMGPIPSSGNGKKYFSDIYISSYTPTLSALITSRNSDVRHHDSKLPNILLVAQPNPSLPGVSGEIQVIQSLKPPVTSLISRNATPSSVLDGLRHHRFCHFACHGVLRTGKPFDSSFILHNEEPLMLLDIVRSRLPAGECAFLATCHTAEPSDESMPSEILHLAAAMQYSGFRSVIGTMWAMADEDGQHLAKYFYESMFSDERRVEPYYEQSARALTVAVQMLRERGVSAERWVNYVHFGA